jgi:hypothetical protein
MTKLPKNPTVKRRAAPRDADFAQLYELGWQLLAVLKAIEARLPGPTIAAPALTAISAGVSTAEATGSSIAAAAGAASGSSAAAASGAFDPTGWPSVAFALAKEVRKDELPSKRSRAALCRLLEAQLTALGCPRLSNTIEKALRPSFDEWDRRPD